MTRQQADHLLLLSLIALGCAGGGAYFGFGFWFAPGWANGWPGVPQRVAWPAGLTALAFLIGMCLVFGTGAAIGSRLGSCRYRVVIGALAVWSVCGLGLVAVACWWLYNDLHSAAAELLP